jgi:hypothetical protein
MNKQNECHKYIESILGLRTDLSIEDLIEMLNELLVNKNILNIKFRLVLGKRKNTIY